MFEKEEADERLKKITIAISIIVLIIALLGTLVFSIGEIIRK